MGLNAAADVVVNAVLGDGTIAVNFWQRVQAGLPLHRRV